MSIYNFWASSVNKGITLSVSRDGFNESRSTSCKMKYETLLAHDESFSKLPQKALNQQVSNTIFPWIIINHSF